MSSIKDTLLNECLNLTKQVEEGHKDPIKVYIELYEMEKIVSELRKEVSDLALDKRTSVGDKEYIQNGYKVSVVSTTRFTYPYDTELERFKMATKNRQEAMKQSFYANKNGRDFYDEYGEVIPPAKSKTTTYLKLEYNG